MNGFNIKLSTAEERIINGGQTRRTCLERSTKSQRDVKYKKRLKDMEDRLKMLICL